MSAMYSCAWCGRSTPVTTLNQLGARCRACYEAYCAAPLPSPAWMADRRKDGPLGSAWALQRAQRLGVPLTLAQLDAMRRVLRLGDVATDVSYRETSVPVVAEEVLP